MHGVVTDGRPTTHLSVSVTCEGDMKEKPTRKRRDRHAPGGFLWSILSYVLTNITVSLFSLFFFVLNRTRVIGRRNVPQERNTLLLSNHQSMIDSFIVGLAAFHPQSYLKPYLIPWNPAAEENFFQPRWLGWLAKHWRCIPVREGRRDPRALHRMVEVLPRGVMTIFPEGTRTRDEEVHEGRAGTGLLILATRPNVVPVAIYGMNDVLPIGRKLPRLFQRVYVYYGEPIDYSEFLDRPRTKDTSQELIDKVMAAIRRQYEELRGIAARDAGDPPPSPPPSPSSSSSSSSSSSTDALTH